MLRSLLSLLLLLAPASVARAHFVFIVPEKGGQTAKAILSESLAPDEDVSIEAIRNTTLFGADAAGDDTALKLSKGEHSYAVDLAAAQVVVIHGTTELGVLKRGNSKPGLLTYYPKTILGDPFDAGKSLGKRAPMELVPIGRAGALKLRLIVAEKPVADAEVTVLLPDGADRKVTTDKEGNTPAFDAAGRYGAWARHVEGVAGDHEGKHYDEVRQYATLVIDVPKPSVGASYAPMPQAASSFGAVACDGWLYLYGGHIADTHAYSTESVSGQFHRLSLADPKAWEKLPSGPALQGMNLATWHGKIYRIGGMSPQNPAGKQADVRSVADCACFDPVTKTWTALPSLPDPRSSHDVVVSGDKLIVVGGWNLAGAASKARWPDTALILDLSAETMQWKAVKQPFTRRALIAAWHQGKIYVIGGFKSESEPSRQVDVYDPAADAWSTGPEIPGADRNGFGPAACTHEGKLYISVADGSLYRLDASGKAWAKVATTTPRIVHRLIPHGSELLVIGGAVRQKQLNLIEAVSVESSPPAAREADAGAGLHPASTQPSKIQ